MAALAAGLLLAGCKRSGPAVETQWRFMGGAALAAQTNAPTLHAALHLKDSAIVRQLLVTNTARLLWRLATGETNPPARVLEPGMVLADRLVSGASLGQTLLPKSGPRVWVVALETGTNTAAVRAAWTNFFGAVAVERGGVAGTPVAETSGQWLVCVSDSAVLKPAEALLQLTKLTAEPGDALRVRLAVAGWPQAELTARLQDGVVRSTARVTFQEKPPATLPAWDIPESVRDPLVQFMAVRWLDPWLAHLPGLRTVLGAEKPGQMFVWSLPTPDKVALLQTYAAVMGINAPKRFEEIVAAVRPLYDVPATNREYGGNVILEPERQRLSLHGTPALPPMLQVLTNAGTPYLLAGGARPPRSTNPPPAELLGQIQRDKLVYYHWEITGEALRGWISVDQLRDMVLRRPMAVRGKMLNWVQEVAPIAGNTITEALVTGPNEVSIQRKAPLGLSSLELAWLAHWLGKDAPLETFRRGRPPGF